jgi:hypothetical protein
LLYAMQMAGPRVILYEIHLFLVKANIIR